MFIYRANDIMVLINTAQENLAQEGCYSRGILKEKIYYDYNKWGEGAKKACLIFNKAHRNDNYKAKIIKKGVIEVSTYVY